MLSHTRVLGIQELTPALVSQLVSLLLGLDHRLVLVELGFPNLQGIVALQRVCRYPSLDGCATPAVDNDALRNTSVLLHTLAQKRADGGKEPGILLVQWFPVDAGGADVILHTLRIGLVLHTEQTYLIIVKMVDFIGISRVDTLDGDIDVGLSGTKPYIAYQHIGQHPIIDGHRIGTTCLHLRQVNAPAALWVSHRSILPLLPTDHDLFARISLAPHGDDFATL